MNQLNQVRTEISELPEPYVILGVGIPGSGKTTCLAQLAHETGVARISPDDIRQELTGNTADQSVNTAAWEITYKRAAVEIEMGNAAIIDATHTERHRRIEAIEMYRAFGALAVVAVVFKVELAVALERNNNRDRVVPEHAIRRMNKNLKHQPVSLAEGFDAIHVIEP